LGQGRYLFRSLSAMGVLFGLVGAVNGAFLLSKRAENTLAALQVEGVVFRSAQWTVVALGRTELDGFTISWQSTPW